MLQCTDFKGFTGFKTLDRLIQLYFRKKIQIVGIDLKCKRQKCFTLLLYTRHQEVE